MADKPSKGSGIEGVLGGLSDLLRNLGQLAEKGAELQREGTFKDAQGRDVNFHYGVSVRTMNGGREMRVEPFGNLKRDQTGEAKVAEVREPMADVFEEKDHILVVLEMPGVTLADVKAEATGDVLSIAAERGAKRYRKEVLLPCPVKRDVQVTNNNGVVEVRAVREQG
ncbi:MAG: Hsp20/alpha crystallin family protein [Planctomycetota bacterium]|nr:Hsp20/alpha crystallin family protein [Planctomycetota bacterium]